MSAPVRISNGNFEANISPQLGGALLNFREHGPQGWVDWLRPAPPDCADVLQSACFPLLPFSNRIAQGRFKWRQKSIALPANFPPEPHAIHGQGWQSAWSVSEQSPGRVCLVLRHERDAWPWQYEARQEIRIDDGALHITLLLVNQSSEPMPAGIGLHPYFPRSNSTHLKADIAAIHLNGPDGFPLERQTNHLAIQSLCGGDALIDGLDNVFENWDGTSLISWPADRKSLTMSTDGNLHHLVVYTPEGADFFCAEPVSHLNGAFGHKTADAATNAGVVELCPGEELKAKVTFIPRFF